MTIAQFNLLSNIEKARLLNKYGVFLAEKTVAGNRLYLYTLNYFYVELEHHLSDINSNGGVTINRAFDDPAYLGAYLDRIGPIY